MMGHPSTTTAAADQQQSFETSAVTASTCTGVFSYYYWSRSAAMFWKISGDSQHMYGRLQLLLVQISSNVLEDQR
jgi:hypothetical protein